MGDDTLIFYSYVCLNCFGIAVHYVTCTDLVLLCSDKYLAAMFVISGDWRTPASCGLPL